MVIPKPTARASLLTHSDCSLAMQEAERQTFNFCNSLPGCPTMYIFLPLPPSFISQLPFHLPFSPQVQVLKITALIPPKPSQTPSTLFKDTSTSRKLVTQQKLSGYTEGTQEIFTEENQCEFVILPNFTKTSFKILSN